MGYRMYHKLKAEFEQKFPIYGVKALNLLRNHLIDNKRYGKITDGVPKPVNTKATLAKGWGKELTLSALYTHFLSDSKLGYLWYTSKNYKRLDGCSYALPMIDIDSEDYAEAEKLAELIRSRLPSVKFYQCPSTNGSGVHMYFVLSMREKTSMEQHEVVTELASSLRCLTADYSGSATLCRVNGATHALEAGGSELSGTLAKLPSFKTEEEAEKLCAALCSAIDCQELQEALAGFKEQMLPANCIASSPLPLPVSPEASNCQDLQDSREGGKEDAICLLGARLSASRTKGKVSKLNTTADTIAKRRTFYFNLCNQRKAVVPSLEALDLYEASGESTGPRSSDRVNNFKQIEQYLLSNFDSSKGSLNAYSFYAQAQKDIETVTSDIQLKSSYGKASNRSTLKTIDLAVVLAAYRYNAKKGKLTVSLTPKYMVELSRSWQVENAEIRLIDHKRFAACKRILEELGYLSLISKGRKGISATQYLVK